MARKSIRPERFRVGGCPYVVVNDICDGRGL